MIRLLNHFLRRQLLLQAAFDLGLVFCIVLGMAALRGGHHPASLLPLVTQSLAIALCLFLLTMAAGVYRYPHHRTVTQSCALAILIAVAALLATYTLLRLLELSPGTGEGLWLSEMMGLGAVLTHRIYWTHVQNRPKPRTRVLIVGAGAPAESVTRSITQADPLAEVVGYYPSPNEIPTVPANRLLSRERSLAATARDLDADDIIVALSERRGGSMPMRELLDCKLYGVRVCDVAQYFERSLAQIRLDYVNAGWLIFGDGFQQGWLRSTTKRIFDLGCALLLLVLGAPLMLLTAIAIKIDSPGPVLYRQQRVGRDGKTFEVIKFRSMRTDAERDGQPRWATAGDDRVTAVGRLIRLCRIDELPQLFNVLAGDMSMVGPRPERPYFVDQLTDDIPYYAVRHSVKPGVTGWAQVRYQYGSTTQDAIEKLQYDLYYVKHHTVLLDLLILFETVVVVLTARGAR